MITSPNALTISSSLVEVNKGLKKCKREVLKVKIPIGRHCWDMILPAMLGLLKIIEMKKFYVVVHSATALY